MARFKMLENRDEYIFPDHHGLLIDGGDRIKFLKIDETIASVTTMIRFQAE